MKHCRELLHIRNHLIGKGKELIMKEVKHPCIGCIYFAACGSTTRTEPCAGRVTKSEKAKENKNEN